MDASLYQPLFLTITIALCVIIGVRYIASPSDWWQQTNYGKVYFPLALCLVLVFWIGGRPISGTYFGDTANYALEYALLEPSIVSMDWRSEWIWQWLMMSCKAADLNVSTFFTIIQAGYVLTAFGAVKRLMPNHPFLGMLFVWASLSYFTYGVNGLRNGLSCHLMLFAMTYLLDSKYIVGSILCLVAFGIHRSSLLPIAAIFAAIFLIRNPKHAIYIWILSIFVSLVAGEDITNFFASLGFDDRMASYTSVDQDMGLFSSTGFRWDFLLYSAMPVVMAGYVCGVKGLNENWYNAICVTYCLCNAFWILVIRAAYSNRFAYLSWFLYPIVIAYPLINMPVWKDQDRKTGLILLAYGGFTAFMNLIYWQG